MKIWTVVIAMFCAMLTSQNPGTPEGALLRLPHASLLVGYPPFFLMVTNPHEDLRLQPEDQPETRDSRDIYPSISRDGKVIAYARVKAGRPHRVVAISTYSAATGKHTDYAEGEYSGAVAISPDASKLAFSGSRGRAEGSGDDHMHIVDLKAGHETLGPEVPSFTRVFASWSPDARRLAYGFDGEIRVWDADTGKISKIADGDAPAWSPSGEWIAYLQGVVEPTSSSALHRPIFQAGRWLPRCLVVHPDGSGKKTLVELPHKKAFLVEAPVWSPDSGAILLNELADVDSWRMDIHLLDVKSLRLRTVSQGAVPVLGWAEAK